MNIPNYIGTVNRSAILDFVRAAGLDPEHVTQIRISAHHVTAEHIHEVGHVLHLGGEPAPAYETRELSIDIAEDNE